MESLSSLLASGKRIPEEDLLLLRVASSLKELHSNQNSFHGALSCDTILWNSDQRVVSLKEAPKKTSTSSSDLLCAAPEPSKSSSQADMWAFGVIVCMVLTRDATFSPHAKGAHSDDISSVVAPPSSLSVFYASLVEDCWMTNPQHRVTASEAYERLCRHAHRQEATRTKSPQESPVAESIFPLPSASADEWLAALFCASDSATHQMLKSVSESVQIQWKKVEEKLSEENSSSSSSSSSSSFSWSLETSESSLPDEKDARVVALSLTHGNWRALKQLNVRNFIRQQDTKLIAEYNRFNKNCSTWALRMIERGHLSVVTETVKELLALRNYDTLAALVIASHRAGQRMALSRLELTGLLEPNERGKLVALEERMSAHMQSGTPFIPVMPVILGQIVSLLAANSSKSHGRLLPNGTSVMLWKYVQPWLYCIHHPFPSPVDIVPVLLPAAPKAQNQSILTERDWQVLMAGEACRYEKGAVILREGSYNSALWRVVEGTLEVRRGDSMVGSSSMTEGSIFGEMSVLSNEQPLCTASVICASATCSVMRVDGHYIRAVLREDSGGGMATRFYTFLASHLAHRLRHLSSERPDHWMGSLRTLEKGLRASGLMAEMSQEVAKPMSHVPSQTPSAPSIDRELRVLFGLSSEVVCVKSYSCTLRGRAMLNVGTLYFTNTKDLLFSSKAFYLKQRLTISLTTVTLIDCTETDLALHVVRNNKKKVYRFTTFDVPILQVVDLCQALWKHHQSQTNPGMVQPVLSPRLLPAPASPPPSMLPHASSSSSPESYGSANINVGGSSSMRSEDWDVLIRGARTHALKDGEIALAQGDPVTGLFQVARGHCNIQVNGEVCGQIQEGEIFGEMAFLPGGGTASASIVASDDVLMHVIPKYFLELCFARFEGLSDRFFEFAAHLIASRLRAREGGIDLAAQEKWAANRGRQHRYMLSRMQSLEHVAQVDHTEGRSLVHNLLRDLRTTGSCSQHLHSLVHDPAGHASLVALARHPEWRHDILAAGGLQVLQDLASRNWEGGEKVSWERGGVFHRIDSSHVTIDWNACIGAGAFCSVFRGSYRNQGKDMEVAVKEVQQHGMFDPAMFRRELLIHTMLGGLEKYVVPLLGCYQDRGKYYMVMPFADTGSLSQMYARKSLEGMSPTKKIIMLLQICKGVSWLHENNVVHRDLKSSNILCFSNPGLTCVLGDLGISRTESSANVTQVVGTSAYFAPELFVNANTPGVRRAIRKSSDIYCLGYVMSEMYLEQDAFHGVEFSEVMRLKQQELNTRRVPINIPQECPWSELIVKCCSFEESDRPTISQVKSALKHLLQVFL